MAAFQSLPHPERHPSRFSLLARLWGMRPALSRPLRILELGCGNGINLLSIASTLPLKYAHGVDSDKEQIAQANKALKASKMRSVDFECADIRSFAAAKHSYDIVLAHGLYSWVSKDIREIIFSLCSDCLTEDGIAALSRNTLPGASTRLAVANYLQNTVHASSSQEAREAIAHLKGVAEAKENHALLRETWNLQRSSDAFLEAELLNPNLNASTTIDFSRDASGHSLQYLGDAHHPIYYHELLSSPLADYSTACTLDAVQTLSLLFPLPHVTSILSRSQNVLSLQRIEEAFEDSFVASPLVLRDAKLITPQGMQLPITAGEAAYELLCELSTIWPSALHLKAGEYSESVRTTLAELFSQGLLEWFAVAPPIDHTSSFRVPALQRFLIHEKRPIYNLRHEYVELTLEEENFVLELNDGTVTERSHPLAQNLYEKALLSI